MLSNPLLNHYYIDTTNKQNIGWIILALLHELRIMTAEQILAFLNLDVSVGKTAVYNNLKSLKDEELIDFIKNSQGVGGNCYYLTKKGNIYFGGEYGYPKNPEYNLNHHLILTTNLFFAIRVGKISPRFYSVLSERRQAYQKKETENKKGKTYNVADFIFLYLTKEEYEIRHYFEVELTLKTKNRYLKGVFPKYFHYLRNEMHQHDQLFYISPTEFILGELRAMKTFYFSQSDLTNEVANRIHIVSTNEFQGYFQSFMKNSRVLMSDTPRKKVNQNE